MNQPISPSHQIKPVFWYMVSQKLSGITKNTRLMHLLVWLLFAGIFFLGISGVESIEKSIQVVLVIFIPSIPAVYLHFFVFDKFFKSKQYWIYLVLAIAIVFVFGSGVESIAKKLIYYADADAYISGKMGTLTFLIISISFRSVSEGIQAKNKLNEIEAKQARAELESLKSQVNPHFLFNSLNNIYGLLMEDKDKAGESILTLSSLLRYLNYASQKSSVSLDEEVKFLEDYMAMERLRLGDKCKLSFEKEGFFSDRSISPFLLIPFVENAFKHGSFATVGESFIEVKLTCSDKQLDFSVRNSIKPNMHTQSGGDRLSDGQGTGIANVRRRLELLLPERHELEAVKDVSEFNVKLKLYLE